MATDKDFALQLVEILDQSITLLRQDIVPLRNDLLLIKMDLELLKTQFNERKADTRAKTKLLIAVFTSILSAMVTVTVAALHLLGVFHK